eukprot:maker-scaffold511_size151351-snap-gene-0.23 protein:Tk01186 transcript:maker-scaffold511_size151351-snap-gene-0.23-mRNA-1 annotation:"spt transcription factor family member"
MAVDICFMSRDTLRASVPIRASSEELPEERVDWSGVPSGDVERELAATNGVKTVVETAYKRLRVTVDQSVHAEQYSCHLCTCRLILKLKMVAFAKICLIALVATASTVSGQRRAKSLVNTFPFSQGGAAANHAHDHDHHDHAHAAHPVQAAAPARASRQGQGDEVALDIGSIAAAGERCIDKVVMVEETEYDEEIECHHSYSERCHTTTPPTLSPTGGECEENFKKSCFIEYRKVLEDPSPSATLPSSARARDPRNEDRLRCETRYHEHEVEDDVVECETIQEEKCEDVTQGYTTEQKCTKWPKQVPEETCNLEPQRSCKHVTKLKCTKWPKQVCKNEKKTVKKYTPETECKKVGRELCGPSGCLLQPGPEECFDKKETVVQEVPEETCNLEPQRSCKHVTKLVPLLKPAEECVDIPKEVCSRSRKNPRKVQKPVVKKWCYVPSEQSGLA